MFTRRHERVEDPRPFWKQRSWQLSAGFLTVVVVLSAVVALTSDRGSDEDRVSAAATDGPLSGTAAMRDGRPQGCRTDDSGGAALPKAAPKDVSWRTLGVVRVPVSASAGPTRIEGGLWWCFAHTPAGAALAANIIPSQMSGSGWRTITNQQVVAGEGRDLWVFTRSAFQDAEDQSGGTAVSTYAGFSVTSYKSTAATVRLLLKTDQGYAATTIGLRWSGGDWKVLPFGDGSLHSPVSTVDGINGFLLWRV